MARWPENRLFLSMIKRSYSKKSATQFHPDRPQQNGKNGAAPIDQKNTDLGFGSKAAEQTARLINKDGSFNTNRRGLPFFESLSFYHELISMSWWKFNALVILLYVAVN